MTALDKAGLVGRVEPHPFVPKVMDEMLNLSPEDWAAASTWADTAKRLMPGMEDARWNGIRHGFAGGLAYARALAAAGQP
jgi:hypothetical protein